MTIAEAVKIRIKEYTKERGLSQYALEQKAALSHSTLKSLMNNHTKGVDLKTIFTIASGLQISISEFFDSPIFDYTTEDIEY